MSVINVNEVKGKEIWPGAMLRTLIPKAMTTSKKLSASNIVIQPGGKMGPIESDAEIFYYVLSGRGNLTYFGLSAAWTIADFEGDNYTYIPPNRPHYILNQGEGPMLLFSLSYEISRQLKAGTGVQTWKKDKSPRVDFAPSCLSRVILPAEILRAKGVEKIYVVEHETFSPRGRMPVSTEEGCDVIYYIIRGTGKITIDDKEYKVKAGSAICVPSGISSSLQNAEEHILETLCISCALE